jgi:hypothetical protein
MDDRQSIAIKANALLTDFIEVHDDLFAPSFFTTLRRAVPVPGIFKAIDFEAHAQRLQRILGGVREVRAQAGLQRNGGADLIAVVTFFRAFDDFCGALESTVSHLAGICEQMSRDRSGRPSWREYNHAVKEYERLRSNQMDAGTRLQQSLIQAGVKA